MTVIGRARTISRHTPRAVWKSRPKDRPQKQSHYDQCHRTDHYPSSRRAAPSPCASRNALFNLKQEHPARRAPHHDSSRQSKPKAFSFTTLLGPHRSNRFVRLSYSVALQPLSIHLSPQPPPTKAETIFNNQTRLELYIEYHNLIEEPTYIKDANAQTQRH